jgi:hypothetical protein
MTYQKKKGYLLLILLVFFFYGCSSTNSEKKDKVLIEPNVNVKTREFADKGGGLFGDLNKKSSGNTFEFASSNVLWRATLQSLDFLPLLNADYSGGVIIYDWYSQTNNPKEQIKISIRFVDNELRSDSIIVTAHKKICDNFDKCSNSAVDQKFSNSIKESIINSARELKIKEAKKEKK